MNVAILGTGKVGSDLLDKVIKSKTLECVMFAGQRKDSPGIKRANKLGVPTSTKSIQAILKSDAEIVFDATTAKAHIQNAPLLKDRFVIDLTPSRVGKMCVPSINLDECLKENNVNLVTCGAQAMCQIAKDIVEQTNTNYIEMVSTISSDSAGLGTRNNIDEFTQTTAEALEELSGVAKAKAIIILNPTDIEMRNTLTWQENGERKSLTRTIETEGNLPGNLEIINRSAITVAEAYENNRQHA